MRLRVLGALVLVVATAGCGALVGGGSSADTLTPAPVPTLAPTPDDPRVGVAPGVSTRGVTNPDYLAARHVAIASEMRYVLNVSYHEDRRLADVPATVDRRQRIVVENATTYRRDANTLQRRVGGSYQFLYGYSEYANGRAKYVSWLGDNDTHRVFRRYDDPARSRPDYASTVASFVREFLDVETATVSRYDVAGSDRQYYLVVGHRTNLSTVSDLENFTARAVIREDGFVRRLNVTYDAMDRGSVVSTHYTVRYREIGTATVSQPAWTVDAYAEFAAARESRDRGTPDDAVDDGRGRTS